MRTLFNEQQLRITTIIINSNNFLLTAQYLIQNLGLAINQMTVGEDGIRKLHLHAASNDKVHALNICLTNDHLAAINYPVLLGAIPENESVFLSNLRKDNGEVTMTRRGKIFDILRWRKINTHENYCPEIPVCLLLSTEFDASQSIRHYDEKAILDWLLITENDISKRELEKSDSWLYWITMKCRSIQMSVDYYRALGFHIEEVDNETYHLLTDTNIGIHLVDKSQSSPSDSSVMFSVTAKNGIGILPSWRKDEDGFAIINQNSDENCGHDVFITDMNNCGWDIHSTN
jgi:predicted lactoylglutathione lyase